LYEVLLSKDKMEFLWLYFMNRDTNHISRVG
jgi:hypothetical protein